jgi:LysR family glycine cleavage system transcriptional activator
LIPRLPDFLRAHPEVTLEVSTSIGPVDFRRSNLDAAIHYGEGVAPGARAEPLFEEVEVVVCSPELRAREQLAVPEDLEHAPLLHLSSRPSAWRDWMDEHGLHHLGGRRGPRFEHHLMVRAAARAGLGVALLPSFVADDALRAGDLIEPIDHTRRRTGRRYWLMVPDRSLELESLRAFRRWLRLAIEREGWT